jgi:hypothetical protein
MLFIYELSEGSGASKPFQAMNPVAGEQGWRRGVIAAIRGSIRAFARLCMVASDWRTGR